MKHDPLCLASIHGTYGEDCICKALRTARLQGPIRETGHAPICWCPRCIEASNRIHGVDL